MGAGGQRNRRLVQTGERVFYLFFFADRYFTYDDMELGQTTRASVSDVQAMYSSCSV